MTLHLNIQCVCNIYINILLFFLDVVDSWILLSPLALVSDIENKQFVSILYAQLNYRPFNTSQDAIGWEAKGTQTQDKKKEKECPAPFNEVWAVSVETVE